jgi:hypothetical protein
MPKAVGETQRSARYEECLSLIKEMVKSRNEDPDTMVSMFLSRSGYVEKWLCHTEDGRIMCEQIIDQWKADNRLSPEALLAARDIAGFSDDRWQQFVDSCPVLKGLIASRWFTGVARRKLDKLLTTKLQATATTHRGVRLNVIATLKYVYELLPNGAYDKNEVQDLALALDGRELGGQGQAMLCVALKSVKGLAKNSPYGCLVQGIAEGIDNTDQDAKLMKKSDPENHKALKDNYGPTFQELREWQTNGMWLELENGDVLQFGMKGGFDLKTSAQLHAMQCQVPL